MIYFKVAICLCFRFYFNFTNYNGKEKAFCLLTYLAGYFGHAPWSNAYEAIVYVLGNDVFGLAFDINLN
jgi:hypothetical protein